MNRFSARAGAGLAGEIAKPLEKDTECDAYSEVYGQS